MVIVSSFKLVFNKVKEYFAVETEEILNCPLCNGELRYRDSVFRKLKSFNSEVTLYLLRRLLCQKCKALHRELPDIIQPYKHYASDVIQAVLDDSEEASDCCADNSTIHRWKAEFSSSHPDISQRLASIYAKVTSAPIPLVKAETILNEIKRKEDSWLPFVMKLLINGGHKICTQFAFCLPERSDKLNSAIKINAEGDSKIDKTNTDTS